MDSYASNNIKHFEDVVYNRAGRDCTKHGLDWTVGLDYWIDKFIVRLHGEYNTSLVL